MMVAVSRSGLDAWVNVFDLADCSLNRVDWLLSSAFKGLMKRVSGTPIDLVWSIASAGHERLLFVRNGVPEVDHPFDRDISSSIDGLTIHDLVSAWRSQTSVNAPLQWHQTGNPSDASISSSLSSLADPLSLGSSPSEQLAPWDPATPPVLLDDLVSLAFEGLDLKL